MAKTVKQSAVAKELKKEYLAQHLKEVEGLIVNWIGQLKVPDPVSPHEEGLGWKSEYRPLLETDSDSNHILRSHIRSRALWRHHTEWERQLTLAWSLVTQLREMSIGQLSLIKDSDTVEIWTNYVGTTLLAAFEGLRRNRRIRMNYKIPENGLGVTAGDFKIDIEAATEKQRKAIQEKHSDLAMSIAQHQTMNQLVDCWHEIVTLERRMTLLVSKILKSRDILFPCRFCRHLWK